MLRPPSAIGDLTIRYPWDGTAWRANLIHRLPKWTKLCLNNDRGHSMLTLKVNGQQQSVDVPPDTPLLWVLRENLGLTGTKFGCGMALCGACTVHLDGEAVRSCVTPMSRAEGKDVTTIEGLGDEVGQALQAAWIAEDVPQCGYCQSGQIMAAAVLLRETSRPSDDDIDDCMTGNICRCGTYQRIRRAIHQAAEAIVAGGGE
jgi:isoquinoline 1-oxidoreductase subunit alpha